MTDTGTKKTGYETEMKRELTQIDFREETNLRQMREQTSKVENSFKKAYLFNVLNLTLFELLEKSSECFK